MIISPRAKPVRNILHKVTLRSEDGSVEKIVFVKIDEVSLYQRKDKDSPWKKTLFWKREKDSDNPGDND
jgi:hypothetical protein